MKLSTAATMIASGQSSLMLQLIRTCNEFYRACFVTSAISHGVYDAFTNGRATIDQLSKRLNGISNREGLQAWPHELIGRPIN